MTNYIFFVRTVTRLSEKTDMVDVFASTIDEAIIKMKKKVARKYGDLCVCNKYMTIKDYKSEIHQMETSPVRFDGVWIQ